MASKAAHKRLSKEYMTMQRDPPPFIWAVPEENNILTCEYTGWFGGRPAHLKHAGNYIIRGPLDSPFAGGEYHGVLLFPSEYPFKPPGIKMLTPSGRFQPDRKICFSMSDFHPGTWNPAWSVSTILTGLLSFMLSDEMTTGSVTSTDDDKRAYAARSHAWNIQQKRFKEAFPDYCITTIRDLPNMGEKERGTPSTNAPSPVAQRQPPASTIAQPAPPTGPTTANPNAIARPAQSTANGEAAANARGWADAWRQVFWEKWRWGVILALALVVSRMSSR
ncbi:UBC-like protein [Fomitopsis betulina]|nr:UBC-like protein [Fomitopsis betulina]